MSAAHKFGGAAIALSVMAERVTELKASFAALDDDAVPTNHRTLALARRFWARRDA